MGGGGGAGNYSAGAGGMGDYTGNFAGGGNNNFLSYLGVPDQGNQFTGGTPVQGMFTGGTPLVGPNYGANRDYEKLIRFGYPENKARWMAGNGINPTWGRVWPSPHWQIGQGHKVL